MNKDLINKRLEEVALVTDNIISANNEKMEEIHRWFENTLVLKQTFDELVAEEAVKERQMREELEDIEKKYNDKCKTAMKKKKEAKDREESLQRLESELTTLKRECEKQYQQCENARRRGEPTVQDRRLLEEAKLKLELNKEMTDIKWDYTAPDEIARGYVRNKTTGYCHAFSYKCSELGQTELCDLLWQEVENGALSHDKENQLGTNNDIINN